MKTDKELEEEALQRAAKVWGNPYISLPYVRCSYCDREVNQMCITDVLEGKSYCIEHWMADWIRREKQRQAKPILDVADFARL